MERFHSRQGGSINCWAIHKTICFWNCLKAELWNNQDTFYHYQCEVLISFKSVDLSVKISALNVLGHIQTEQLLGKSLHNNSTSFSSFSVRAFAGLFVHRKVWWSNREGVSPQLGLYHLFLVNILRSFPCWDTCISIFHINRLGSKTVLMPSLVRLANPSGISWKDIVLEGISQVSFRNSRKGTDWILPDS